MAKAKVIAFTEYRYENGKFNSVNLVFVRKNFDTIDFTGIIKHYSFDTIKDYIDTVRRLAEVNNYDIDYVSQYEGKNYNIMFRNMDSDAYKFLKYVY